MVIDTIYSQVNSLDLTDTDIFFRNLLISTFFDIWTRVSYLYLNFIIKQIV